MSLFVLAPPLVACNAEEMIFQGLDREGLGVEPWLGIKYAQHCSGFVTQPSSAEAGFGELISNTSPRPPSTHLM